MKILRRKSLVLAFSLVLLATGAFWATSSLAAGSERLSLLKAEGTVFCDVCDLEHVATFTSLGTIKERPGAEPSQLVAEAGAAFQSKSGRTVVPIHIRSLSGKGFVEGVGETRFWLDATRPETGAIWERTPGTGFPAIQEMRFHFFYTVEAFPGKVFRSLNPAIMRSDNVLAFPPPPETRYRLVEPVDLEDISEPGVVAGQILRNRAVIPHGKPNLLIPNLFRPEMDRN